MDENNVSDGMMDISTALIEIIMIAGLVILAALIMVVIPHEMDIYTVKKGRGDPEYLENVEIIKAIAKREEGNNGKL